MNFEKLKNICCIILTLYAILNITIITFIGKKAEKKYEKKLNEKEEKNEKAVSYLLSLLY